MTRARFNATVLNVHPDTYVRSRRTDVLCEAGFDVREAASSAEALACALESSPDVVLVTKHLTPGNGTELCRTIKGDPATASIMVIESSDRCTPADRADALETGADALLPEPLDTDELVAVINALVRVRWCREQLRDRVDELERELRELVPGA